MLNSLPMCGLVNSKRWSGGLGEGERQEGRRSRGRMKDRRGNPKSEIRNPKSRKAGRSPNDETECRGAARIIVLVLVVVLVIGDLRKRITRTTTRTSTSTMSRRLGDRHCPARA